MTDPASNPDRMSTILGRTFETMRDGQWRTLSDIEAITGDDAKKIASRLRDLRMTRYGGYSIDTQQVSAYVWKYRLNNVGTVVPLAQQAQTPAPAPAPAPAPSPFGMQWTISDDIRFMNTQTLQVEEIEAARCEERSFGNSTRVVALDGNGDEIGHLVTTQRKL